MVGISKQRPIKPTTIKIKPRGINTTPIIIGIVKNPTTDRMTPVINTADNGAKHVEAAKKFGWQGFVYDPTNTEKSNRELQGLRLLN